MKWNKKGKCFCLLTVLDICPGIRRNGRHGLFRRSDLNTCWNQLNPCRDLVATRKSESQCLFLTSFSLMTVLNIYIGPGIGRNGLHVLIRSEYTNAKGRKLYATSLTFTRKSFNFGWYLRFENIDTLKSLLIKKKSI